MCWSEQSASPGVDRGPSGVSRMQQTWEQRIPLAPAELCIYFHTLAEISHILEKCGIVSIYNLSLHQDDVLSTHLE
jgi:hypothetical protein